MSEEGVVLGIDAKFLQNLREADKALQASAAHSRDLADQFIKAMSGSSVFAQQMKNVRDSVLKINSISITDFSTGLAKIDVSARNSVDAVNLLTTNMQKLVQEFRNLEHGKKNSSTALRITDEKDLQNIGKLRQAIAKINSTLGNKSRKRPLTLFETNSLIAQRDLYKRIISELNQTDSKRTKHVIDEVNKQIREHNRVVRATQESARTYHSSTPERAMQFADQAKSFEQLKQAYSYLEAARNRINPDTAAGRRDIAMLNEKLRETGREINEISGATLGVNNVARNIGSLFATVFSVQAVRGFLDKLVSIRGEFEMQHRSLQVLLRSRAQADNLWQQTTKLALKSPFNVKQLVTATKQLAAYRVEAGKLHSTTKMLADISAGLGVEINRLILAFGQVKAAGFLRGTELRQFTEAGVNMLDELAAYYTNIEGKTVTAAEVFDRISKRMVSFKDVEKVLMNMTSTGGTFFNMQEEQAETLRGKISNLKDSIQLMLNDIGDSSTNILTTIIEGIRTLTDNWETITKILAPLASLWAVYTLGVKTNTAAIYGNVAASRTSVLSMAGMKTALKAIITGFKTAATAAKGFFASIGPLGWAMLAIEGIISLISEYSVDLSEINKEINKLSNTAGSISAKFQIAADDGDIDKQKAAIRDMLDFAERELILKITPKIDLDSETINAEELKAEMAEIQTQINNQLALNRSIQSGVEEREASFFTNDISKDVEQYEKFVNREYTYLVDLRNKLLGELSDQNRELSDSDREILEELKSLDKGATEDMASHHRRLKTLVRDSNNFIRSDIHKLYKDVTNNSGTLISDLTDNLLKHGDTYSELLDTEFKKAFKDIDLKFIPEEDRAVQLKAALDDTAAKKQWGEWTRYVMYDWAKLRFGLNLTPTPLDDKKSADEEKTPKPPEPKGPYRKDPKWQNAIDAIKKYNDAYEKFRKNNDHTEAAAKTWKYYGTEVTNAAKKAGLSIDQFLGTNAEKLTTLEGTTAALEKLKSLTKYDEDKKKAGEIILGISIDDDERLQEKLLDELTASIDNAFSGYEISVELDKLHLKTGFGETFFGVDAMSIEELRKKIVDSEEEFNKHGIKGQEAYKKFLDKIDDMELKAQQERLKKYINFARESIGERAKIMLDGFYELQEIENAFQPTTAMALKKGIISEKERDEISKTGISLSELLETSDELKKIGLSQQTIDKLKAYNKELQKEAEIAKNASKENVAARIAQKDWDAFRSSDTFQTLFNDLEGASKSALDALVKHLEKYKDQWDKLPLGQMKQMVKLLEEAKRAQSDLVGPMAGLRDARTKMTESGYTNKGEAEKSLFEAEEKIREIDNDIDILLNIERLTAEGQELDKVLESLPLEEAALWHDKNLSSLKSQKDELGKTVSNAKQFLDNLKRISIYYNEIRERISKVKAITDKCFDGWDAINELFDDGSLTKGLAELVRTSVDLGYEAAGLVTQYKEARENISKMKDATREAGEQAELFGYQMDSALGIIGLIVIAVKLISKTLKFAFEQHDKKLQEQIDTHLADIEELQIKYEDLEKSIEKAFTAVNLKQLTKDAKDNLESQIQHTRDMITLENDKKKTDQDAIKGWNDSIREMENRLEELSEEIFSTLTDGILDNVLSATRDFVDAWHDAYEETGNGMKGLEETFTDMLRNMLRQQASMQLISPFIDDYKTWLKEYVNADSDPTLTAEEARMWAERVRETFPEVNELLENFFEGTQGLLETGGELSDLEKGIQGMTEDQAEVLAAYWNSCRFILSNIDTTLTKLANATLNADETSNPVVSALKEQTEIIRTIRNMFSGVIDQGGSPHNGAYLKVYMP